jgi:hypothetical protein
MAKKGVRTFPETASTSESYMVSRKYISFLDESG